MYLSAPAPSAVALSTQGRYNKMFFVAFSMCQNLVTIDRSVTSEIGGLKKRNKETNGITKKQN